MRRAPNSLPRVEEVLGKQVGQPTFAKPPSYALLEAVRDGDREASGERLSVRGSAARDSG